MDLIELFLSSFVTGVAVALGTVIANWTMVKNLEKLLEKMSNGKNTAQSTGK